MESNEIFRVGRPDSVTDGRELVHAGAIVFGTDVTEPAVRGAVGLFVPPAIREALHRLSPQVADEIRRRMDLDGVTYALYFKRNLQAAIAGQPLPHPFER